MPSNTQNESKLQHGSLPVKTPPIVSAQEWETARQQLLVKEKALTHARDALAAERRRMPWLAVDKSYEFEGPNGKESLAGLFDGRRQLIVYRAFFEPGVYGWPEHACRGCSLVADQVAHLAHLNARDTTLAFVSRAPLADIERLKAGMGWTIPWYSITDSFDKDFGVDEWHGTNAFIRNGDKVFRTYFLNNRGDEQMGSTWNYLDITALGRQEEWEDSPDGYPQTPPYKWWNWHDAYDNTSSSQWSSVVDRGLVLQGQRVERSGDRSWADVAHMAATAGLENRHASRAIEAPSRPFWESRRCSSGRVRQSRSRGAHPCRRRVGCRCPAAGRCRWRGCGCRDRGGWTSQRRFSACGSR